MRCLMKLLGISIIIMMAVAAYGGERYTGGQYDYTVSAPRIYDSQGNYRGQLSDNPYNPESVNNPYGRFGSPHSAESINNPYGPGSPYKADSPNNPYGQGMRIYGE
jgi:hypothetical protein